MDLKDVNLDVLQWENIAYSDRYRSLESDKKNQVKEIWLNGIAPVVSPNVLSSPEKRAGFVDYMNKVELPGLVEGEKDIITPDTLTLEGITKMETSPKFAEKSYREQVHLRDIWFRKMAINDPKFEELDPEQQDEYYMNTVRRPPKYQQFTQHPAFSNLKGFFVPIDPELREDLSVDQSKVTSGTQHVIGNFLNSFATGAASLITAPIRLATGPDSAVSQALRDIQKESDWLHSLDNKHPILTSTLPSMAGFVAGLATGPFAKFEKALAGATTLIKGAKGVHKITSTPGLFEVVGKTMTNRIPKLGYRVAGGATAGAVQGISQAISEEKPWNTYLATDMTIGVGFEFLTRYMGAVRQIKKAAKSANLDVEGVLKKPFQVGDSKTLPDEMQAIFAENPDMAEVVRNTKATDKDGMILKWMQTEDGVKAKGDILGFDVKKVEDHYEVFEKGTNKKIRDFTGPVQKELREINDFLDLQDDAWEKAIGNKTLYESVATAPTIEMRKAQFVPTQARKKLMQELQKHNIFIKSDYKVDPRGDTSKIDELFGVIYDLTPGKAAKKLGASGVVFDTDMKENLKVIKQLKYDMETIMPKEPFVYVNKKTDKVLDPDVTPKVILEHPDITQPFYNSRIYTGSPRNVSSLLDTIKSTERSYKQKIGKKATGVNIDTRQVGNHKGYELITKIPGKDKQLHEVVMHFPTEHSIHEFLRRGNLKKGVKGSVVHRIFEDDDVLTKQFEDFEKAYKQSNPHKFAEEAMPFQFTGKMAKDKGYHLGILKGKYILQDSLDINDVRYTSFNTLQDTITFLRHTDPGTLRPDMLGIADEVLEDAGMPLVDLLDDIPYRAVKRNRKFGILQEMGLRFKPTQYAVQQMEKLEVVKMLNKKFGFSPTGIYNKIEDAHRARAAFEGTRRKWIDKTLKGVNEKEANYMTRWIESLTDMSESKIKGVEYRLKSEVEEEMVSVFGRQRTDDLLRRSVEIENFYDELFSLMDMRWSSYIKHYSPHMNNQISRSGSKLSTVLDARNLTDIPSTDGKMFFELLRDIDPRDVVRETDIRKLAKTYNHLAARVLNERPVLNSVKAELKHFTDALKKNGAKNDDYEVIANYFGNLVGTIQGLNSPGDRRLRYAVDRTFEELDKAWVERTGKSLTKGKSFDPVSKLITISTGAHLAARPYPILRNLTQSLITGSFIGPQWWMEGVDRTMQPGQLKRLMDIGIIEEVVLPSGSGFSIDPNSIIAKGMAGYKWADWINRAITYTGSEARFDNAVELFKKGKINKEKFFRMSGMKLFGNAEFNEMADVYNVSRNKDAAFKTIKDRVAQRATAKSQYLYTRFDHPEAFRSSIGRIFGQYTSWPLNYYNFVKSMITSDSLSVIDKAEMIAGVGAATAAVAKGSHEAGINPKSFLPWQMAIMGPGPYHQMITDGLKGINGDRMAMNDFINNITSVLPFLYEGEGLWKAAQALSDGDMYEAVLHAASAPVRYDLFPHRTTPVEAVREQMRKAGALWIKTQTENPLE